MTIAPSITRSSRQPAGIDRLAQRLGLALVAWSQRSKPHPEVVPTAGRADHRAQRAAQQLLSQRDELRATVTTRLF